MTSSFSVDVDNNGSANADSVELVILLPETNTSPTVHVLGELSNIDSRCVQVDTTLECDLGRIRKGKSTSVSFDFAAPWASVDQAISGPAGVTNRHCTGTDLTAFYECELYPSSISSHDILLEADGSITFAPGVTGTTGSWWQDTDDHLHFEYEAAGQTRVIFDGNGVGGDVFEGIATFPGTPYNAAYNVYFREL